MDRNLPNYYAIIPASVRYDVRLCANAKLLFAEITALSDKTGRCWATNEYFAELYGVEKETVSRWVSKLVKCGYVNSYLEYKENSKEILARYITIIPNPIDKKINTPIDKKINTPIDEKVKDNTTSINTTSIYIYGEEFFKQYPSEKKNMKKADVIKKFTANASEEELKRRIEHLQKQKTMDRKWLAGFVPNISTYLNQERWNMEIEKDKTKQKTETITISVN